MTCELSRLDGIAINGISITEPRDSQTIHRTFDCRAAQFLNDILRKKSCRNPIA